MSNIINSVLGFDLKSDITDLDGNIILSGSKCNYIPEESPVLINQNLDIYNKWDNFNYDLLRKIRDCKKYR